MLTIGLSGLFVVSITRMLTSPDGNVEESTLNFRIRSLPDGVSGNGSGVTAASSGSALYILRVLPPRFLTLNMAGNFSPLRLWTKSNELVSNIGLGPSAICASDQPEKSYLVNVHIPNGEYLRPFTTGVA